MTDGLTAQEPGSPTSAGRRLGLVTVDQVLSGVVNVAALVWVAHATSPIAFGEFSLVMMVFMVAQVAFRSLVSTTVLVHPEDADHRARSVLGSAALLSSAAGLVCIVAALGLRAVGSGLGVPLLVLGLALPLLLMQDVGRYLAIARHRPSYAVALDLVWMAGLAVGFPVLQMLGSATLGWLVAVWAASGAVAGLVVLVQYGMPARDGLRWVRDRWDFSWRSMVSGLTASATVLVTSSLMALFSSPVAVAAFRAATLLASPSTAVQMAVSTSAATDIARERDDLAAVTRHMRRAIAIAAAIGVANLIVLVFLPDVIGRMLLGEAWTIVEPFMLAVSLRIVLMSAQAGIRASLIGRHRIQLAMVTDIVSMVLVGLTMVAGAALGDVAGALWGMAAGTGVSTLCWYVALWWDGREPREDAAPVAGQMPVRRNK
ncbi:MULTISPECIES: hypothetical protein [Nocardioides]|uniref:Lipopolysaccharide biosynthesis protein n=1 Tax=Nocardioides vastitatis TaxID=2568655 RepID=A0ABW0Z9C8_9ACTN|nr:hypothetical protein [Nocardioides sp.]THJ02335.1 hypothetical protein E7Z54_10360 [Nocardioides sp.]